MRARACVYKDVIKNRVNRKTSLIPDINNIKSYTKLANKFGT